jgi:hypothetical protein
MSGVEDVEGARRSHKHPYTARNPIPTVQRYRHEKEQREEQYGHPGGNDDDDDDGRSTRTRIGDAFNAFTQGAEPSDDPSEQPYSAENKNLVADRDEADDHAGQANRSKNTQLPQDQAADQDVEDSTQGVMTESDPKKARKQMKKFSADGTEREVTDPITHLPVSIHDFTPNDLKRTAKNAPAAGIEPKTRTGTDAIEKTDDMLKEDEQDSKDSHTAMQVLFPPPDFDNTREEITAVYRRAVEVGLGVVAVGLLTVRTLFWFTRGTTGWTKQAFHLLEIATSLAVTGGILMFFRQWADNKIKNVWDVEVWQAERQQGRQLTKTQTAESTQWLNSLLASIWPLVNPDLFASITDTLEVSLLCPWNIILTNMIRTSCKLVCQVWSAWLLSKISAKVAKHSEFSAFDGSLQALLLDR